MDTDIDEKYRNTVKRVTFFNATADVHYRVWRDWHLSMGLCHTQGYKILAKGAFTFRSIDGGSTYIAAKIKTYGSYTALFVGLRKSFGR